MELGARALLILSMYALKCAKSCLFLIEDLHKFEGKTVPILHFVKCARENGVEVDQFGVQSIKESKHIIREGSKIVPEKTT